jgi:hypothetical protein
MVDFNLIISIVEHAALKPDWFSEMFLTCLQRKCVRFNNRTPATKVKATLGD